MAKLGLLIFNGCSFSLFKYILVSVEHASQYLITVCFGLKLIMKHLKGGCAEQLGLSRLRGSSENRSTPSPRGGTVPLLPRALGGLCLRPSKLFFHSFGLDQKPLTGDRQLLCACFAAQTPACAGQVATSRAEPPAQRRALRGAGWLYPVPNPCPWVAAGVQAAPGLAHRRQLAQRRSLSFLCSNHISLSYLQLPLNLLSFPLTPIPSLGEVSLCES